MDILLASGEWILNILVSLVVPALVWATVIAGLILIVRDKVEEKNLPDPLIDQDTDLAQICCEWEVTRRDLGSLIGKESKP